MTDTQELIKEQQLKRAGVQALVDMFGPNAAAVAFFISSITDQTESGVTITAPETYQDLIDYYTSPKIAPKFDGPT